MNKIKMNKIYTEKDIILHPAIKSKKLRAWFETSDKLYHTEADSSYYSYWYDNKGAAMYSSISYDYCFACEEGKKSAVELLNKHLE
jgi:uncharacterized protein YcfL